jgi:MFS family permease
MLGDVYVVAKGPERRAFFMAVILAVFNQATASTAVINYAPEVLAAQLRVSSESNAILYPAVISLTKCVGVGIALSVVDDLGRRPLLIAGGLGCAVSLWAAAAALGAASVTGFLASLCLFIFCFSLSWAGLYWVVVSEIFSMTVKSPASSAATSLLFLTGSLVDLVFLSLMGALGRWAFVLFGLVALASAAYVWRAVPETKGKTLAEVQAVLAGTPSGAAGGGGGGAATSGSNSSAAAAAGAAASGSSHSMWPPDSQQQQQQHQAFVPVYSLGEDSPRVGAAGEQARLLSTSGLAPHLNGGAAGAHDPSANSGPISAAAATVAASGTGEGLSAVEQSYLQQAWQRQQQQQQQLHGSAGGGLLLPLGAELQPGRSRAGVKP